MLRNLIGMSYETYWQLARYGFLAVILVLQIPYVRIALGYVTITTLQIMSRWFGLM